MKIQSLFIVDLFLVLFFISTVYTGIALHMAGHSDEHVVWHNWAVAHVLFSLFFVIVAVLHIKQHWGWYKSLVQKFVHKKKVTLILTVAFLLVVLTGLFLLCFGEGANTPVGLLHYKIGIFMGILGIGHFLKRYKILAKGLKSC